MNFTNTHPDVNIRCDHTHPDVNIRAKHTKPTGYNFRSEDLRNLSPVI